MKKAFKSLDEVEKRMKNLIFSGVIIKDDNVELSLKVTTPKRPSLLKRFLSFLSSGIGSSLSFLCDTPFGKIQSPPSKEGMELQRQNCLDQVRIGETLKIRNPARQNCLDQMKREKEALVGFKRNTTT